MINKKGELFSEFEFQFLFFPLLLKCPLPFFFFFSVLFLFFLFFFFFIRKAMKRTMFRGAPRQQPPGAQQGARAASGLTPWAVLGDWGAWVFLNAPWQLGTFPVPLWGGYVPPLESEFSRSLDKMGPVGLGLTKAKLNRKLRLCVYMRAHTHIINTCSHIHKHACIHTLKLTCIHTHTHTHDRPFCITAAYVTYLNFGISSGVERESETTKCSETMTSINETSSLCLSSPLHRRCPLFDSWRKLQ